MGADKTPWCLHCMTVFHNHLPVFTIMQNVHHVLTWSVRTFSDALIYLSTKATIITFCDQSFIIVILHMRNLPYSFRHVRLLLLVVATNFIGLQSKHHPSLARACDRICTTSSQLERNRQEILGNSNEHVLVLWCKYNFWLSAKIKVQKCLKVPTHRRRVLASKDQSLKCQNKLQSPFCTRDKSAYYSGSALGYRLKMLNLNICAEM